MLNTTQEMEHLSDYGLDYVNYTLPFKAKTNPLARTELIIALAFGPIYEHFCVYEYDGQQINPTL